MSATAGRAGGKPRSSEAPYTGREHRVQARNDGPLLLKEEQQLMEGLLAGNDDAIRALYARYGRPIYSLGYRLLGTRESAEEPHAGRLPHRVAQGSAVRPLAGALDVADDDRAQPRGSIDSVAKPESPGPPSCSSTRCPMLLGSTRKPC